MKLGWQDKQDSPNRQGITIQHFLNHKCYISPILDMNTNEIVSYDLSTSPNLSQVSHMLEKAFEKFPDLSGLIFHSDYAEEKTMPKFMISPLH